MTTAAPIRLRTTESSTPSDPLAEAPAFDELDATHALMHRHLDRLRALAARLDLADLDLDARAEAGDIEAFFSGSSRDHHREEERRVFPPLLASGDEALVAQVRMLQQDHGWLEENWIEIGPRLRALADGSGWVDPAEFQHDVGVFHELCLGHIALEESLIYPESRARWEAVLGRRRR